MARAILSLGWVIALVMISFHDIAAEVGHSPQVIVYLSSSDFITLPEGKSGGAVDEAQFSSSSLQALFAATGAEILTKAFPNYTAQDTVIIDFEGKRVRIGDLTRVITVDFKNKDGAEAFLAQVRTPQSMKRLKALMDRLILENNLASAAIPVIADEIGKDPEIQELRRLHQQYPEIDWAELNYTGQYCYAPNDPRLPIQWNLKSSQGIGAVAAWDIETQTLWPIAIVDQGIHDHRDISFTGHETASYDHGLAVGGIAGAKTDNGLDMAGVAWNTNLGSFYGGAPHPVVSNTIGAIYDAMSHGIMNLSAVFGDEPLCYGLGHAVSVALNAGKLLCCASGNDGASWPKFPAYWALAVGATTNLGRVASYSNRRPDLVAPGGDGSPEGEEDILSLWYEEPYYSWWSGTSFAAPHAAGVAGLLSRAYYYEQGSYQCTRSDLQRLMEITATDVEEPGWDTKSGWGRIDARDALELIEAEGPNRIKRFTASGYDYYTEGDGEVVRFIAVEDLPLGDYLAKKYTMYKNVTWGHPAVRAPWVWVNEHYTNGYSSMDPNYGTFWGYVVDGSVTTTSATLYTQIYEVFAEDGGRIGWYPCELHEVSFSYSVLGEFNLFRPALSVSLIQNADNHYFHVAWADSNEFHEGYKLQCKRGGGSWETVANLPATCHSYNYTPVWGSQMHYFRVRATWGDDFSDWSSEVGLLNVPNPATSVQVSLKHVCGWPGNEKLLPEFDGEMASARANACAVADSSEIRSDNAPAPEPEPPCFPANLAYVSWEPPEYQVQPVEYYKVRLLLYIGGIPAVYWAGPYSAEACTLCLWPNKQYWVNVVAYALGLHSDEVANTKSVTTGETVLCTDYDHKGPLPETPEPGEPTIQASSAPSDELQLRNRPNPFNPETDLSYNLPDDCTVRLVVYNTLGQKVRVLADEHQQAGLKTIHWDGRDDGGNELASGVYFCRLQAGRRSATKKMILMR